MPKVKRILVPLDFSHGSRTAYEWATALSQLSGAEVELLHVWPAAGGEKARLEAVKEMEALLGTLVRRPRSSPRGSSPAIRRRPSVIRTAACPVVTVRFPSKKEEYPK